MTQPLNQNQNKNQDQDQDQNQNQNQNHKGKNPILKKVITLAVALAMLILAIKIPLPASILQAGDVPLTPVGRTALGVLLFSLVLWVTEAIPFHMTGLLGIFLLALLGVDKFTNIVKIGFGNDIVIFFLGVLILSSYISRSGFGKRISLFILSKTGNSTAMILLGFLVAGCLISMWITDMAVAAMLMPLARAILKEEGLRPLESRFGRALLIACAWGPSIGGIGTPAGAGTNPLAIGFLKSMAGIDITFLKWMLYGVPAALLLIPPTWAVLMLFFRPELKRLSKTREEMQAEFRNLPRMDREEKVTVFVFMVTVALWITSPMLGRMLGIDIPISMPAILTCVLFFLPGMSRIRWKEIEPDISWDGILLILAGISIGMMLYNSGAAKWLSLLLLGGIGNLHPFLLILAVVLIVSLLKVGLSSNTVTAAIVIPIVISMAQGMNLSVMAVALPAGITASVALVLVTSTPTNVIPYSAGYFTIGDMARAGSVLTLIASLVLAAVIYVIGGLTGVY